jgi:hypothetical protein
MTMARGWFESRNERDENRNAWRDDGRYRRFAGEGDDRYELGTRRDPSEAGWLDLDDAERHRRRLYGDRDLLDREERIRAFGRIDRDRDYRMAWEASQGPYGRTMGGYSAPFAGPAYAGYGAQGYGPGIQGGSSGAIGYGGPMELGGYVDPIGYGRAPGFYGPMGPGYLGQGYMAQGYTSQGYPGYLGQGYIGPGYAGGVGRSVRGRIDEGMRAERRARGPKNYRRNDERIRDDIYDLLLDNDWADASNVEVTVSNGEVTLSGTVVYRRDKRLFEDLAESVLGVKDVNNQLRKAQELSSDTDNGSSSKKQTQADRSPRT